MKETLIFLKIYSSSLKNFPKFNQNKKAAEINR